MKGPKDGNGIGGGTKTPEGVLHDAKLSRLGEAHAQKDNELADNQGANWGGKESQDIA